MEGRETAGQLVAEVRTRLKWKREHTALGLQPLPQFKLTSKGPEQLEVCQTQACGKGQLKMRYR